VAFERESFNADGYVDRPSPQLHDREDARDDERRHTHLCWILCVFN